MLPRQLHTRLMLAVTLVMVLGTLGLALWTSSSQSTQLLQARISQAELLSANLAAGAAHAYVIEDFAMLDDYLRSSALLPGLRRIVAIDSAGAVLSAFERTNDTASQQMIVLVDRLSPPTGSTSSLLRTRHNQLVAWQPVSAGSLLGWLQLTYGLEEIEQLQEQIWHRALILSFVEVLIGTSLFMLLLRRPIKSINMLSRFARELPQRRGETIPVEHSVAEVQTLGESLNYASTELHRIEQELLELNRTLEQRVEEALVSSRDKDALLLQQARYQTVGELLVNIAHHWRQPLNNIGALVQENAWLISQGELAPADAMEGAERVMQHLKQLSHSIDLFQQFCHPADGEEQLLPSRVVASAMQMVQAGYQQQGISISFELKAELPIMGAQQLLVQCLINLFANARDAILGRQLTNGRIIITLDCTAERIVQIKVADNGGGIPEKLSNCLFDAYVTSKFRAQGVGLGLFIVRQIVEQQLHGRITAANGPDGAVFTIEIPGDAGGTDV